MKARREFLACLGAALLAVAAPAFAELYTAPDPVATGGITGRLDATITHAVALERDRKRCYLGKLEEGGKAFRFAQLPVGRYDLLLVSTTAIYEGVYLGDPGPPPPANLEKRVAVMDAFFNRHRIHRTGYTEDLALLVIERVRDRTALTQGGQRINGFVRRFEVATFQRATDDWQLTDTRHVFREVVPPDPNVFSRHHHVPALGNIRVIQGVKELGAITVSPR